MPLLYDPLGVPVEISAGRGDLRYSSVPFGGNWSYGVPQIGRPNVSFAQIFATQPWIAAAVMRLMTWAVRVPLKAYRRTGDDSRVQLLPGEHPIADAITNPAAGMSQAEFVMALLGPLWVNGNAVAQVQSGARDSVQLAPCDWRFSTPVMLEPDWISGWNLTQRGQTQTVGVGDVLHLKHWSPLGAIGISPLQQLGVTLEIEDGAQRYQVALFANGARPPSAITASTEFLGLDRDERQGLLNQLRQDVTALYANPDNAGRPALLPPGLDWKEVGHNAIEAELIAQRKVTREEVSAVYQVQPAMLGVLDKSTFNNIDTARQMAYTDSVGPPLVLLEQAINSQVIVRNLGEMDVFVAFDFSGVLRGDRLKEIEALQAAIGMGMMTPNEGRSVINMPRSDASGMDAFWIPTNNFTEIGRAVGDTAGSTDSTSIADDPFTLTDPSASDSPEDEDDDE